MNQKNIEKKNRKFSSGKIYLSERERRWLINGAIAFIPAIILALILIEAGLSKTLASVISIISLAYLVGLIRNLFKK
ncbi:hypothetical protein KKC65_01590 [Patescibacteria group bacterium]|nr:hypothetical protein [Patescibacteria group bacterium]